MISSLKSNNVYYLLALLSAVVVAIIYASFDSLVVMEQKWSVQEEYGYAYIVPFITVYFIWQRLEELADTSFQLSWAGGILLLGSLFIMLLGIISATHSITQYGAVFSIISATYLFIGTAALRVIIGPLLLLLLIVPLPVFLFNSLSAFLQLVSSEIGVWFIRLFGISVYLEGNVIDLGEFKLQVVEACSGLRYLFPLFSLSVIAAFMYNVSLWKRVVVVLSSLPITVFMNSFRIGAIGVLVEYWGIEQAEGFLHDFEGWIIFMACTALIIIEMWLLHKLGSDNRKFSEVFGLDAPKNKGLKFKVVDFGAKYIVVAMVIISTVAAISLVNERSETIPEREEFVTFPLTIDGWKGHRGSIEANVLDELRLDDYIMADYANANGDAVNFYVAYYKAQRSGQAAHSPKSCIPGGGWKIESFSTWPVVVSSTGVATDVNRLLIVKGDDAQLVYYWFPQRGRIITNEYLVKWYLFWDSLTINRTDGALVRITTVKRPGESIEDSDKRLSSFAQSVEPVLDSYLPD